MFLFLYINIQYICQGLQSWTIPLSPLPLVAGQRQVDPPCSCPPLSLFWWRVPLLCVWLLEGEWPTHLPWSRRAAAVGRLNGLLADGLPLKDSSIGIQRFGGGCCCCCFVTDHLLSFWFNIGAASVEVEAVFFYLMKCYLFKMHFDHRPLPVGCMRVYCCLLKNISSKGGLT